MSCLIISRIKVRVGPESERWFVSQGGALAPWLLKITVAQGCQGRHRPGLLASQSFRNKIPHPIWLGFTYLAILDEVIHFNPYLLLGLCQLADK